MNNSHGGNINNMSEDVSGALVFFVNGRKIEDPRPCPEMTLLVYLRTRLGLCGTKLGCGEGGCGACTVMVSFLHPLQQQTIKHISVNACLAPVVSVHGMAVTTVEGIGSTRTRLHAVQERIANSHGSQCGFCTPGIVMSMYTLLRNNPKPDMEDINTYLQGNLCRCTGYRPILEGFKTFTESWAKENVTNGGCKGPVNGVCCQANGGNCGSDETTDKPSLFEASKFQPYDPTQEPIFPPELKLTYSKLMQKSLRFESDAMKWFRPVSLDELLSLKSNNPEAKIVIGNTELGVEMKFKKCSYPVMIQPIQVPELNDISVSDEGITIGSAVTLSSLEDICQQEIKRRPSHATRVYVQIVEMMRWFAGKQIRNVGAVGGNIMTGSPISDLNPIFMAAGCKLKLQKLGSPTRTIVMDSSFYTGYRKNVLLPDEVLVSITVPATTEKQYFVAYKQARRRDDDIAIVNAGFFFEFDYTEVIKVARMSFGGMAPTTVMPAKTMRSLTGAKWCSQTIEHASEQLLEDLPLPPGVPGAMVRYRRALTISLLFKAFLTISKESGLVAIPQDCLSATNVFHKEDIKSHQLFEIKSDQDLPAVGQPLKHKSADKQATGEAVYIDDMPKLDNEVFAAFVYSTKAHAKINGVDIAAAMQVPGVVDFVSYKDMDDERNEYSVAIRRDEKVFVKDEVTAVGQVIGAVVAKDQSTAQKAAQLVKVNYEVLPAIVTMEEAIAANSYHHWDDNTIKCGDPLTAMKSCDHVIKGQLKLGGQEHFYLETHANIAVPSNEDGEMCIYSSTQNPTETQECVAHALGVEMNKVVCRVKRMGGGFGGKETRNILVSTVCAVAAAKVKRPVRAVLDRDEDMVASGHRHPFMGRYTAGYDKDGIIKALDIDLYNNGGCTMDLSFSVMGRAMFHCENSYHIEHVHVRGHVCKTNLPSNTAFRGFGGPQGLLIMENLIDEIANKLSLDPEEVRRKNLSREVGDKTFFSQPLTNCTIRRCWSECLQQSQYVEQKKAIDEFNKSNRWKKRGISIVPVRFGIAFTLPLLNQGGALIQIYRDGSVLLTHGGTEMGQGLHTKMIQVASQALGIPHEKIHIAETATDKVPNTSPTAASMGSDINGMATFNACQVLSKRLEPLKKPGQTWEQLVMAAYCARISLSATGFYSTPDLNYDIKTNSGNAFNYFTYGVGCSTVEIDCLTGDHDLLRTDIVMDIGESINPAIDIGQIEGAFVQGYGLFVLEQLVHTPEGDLLTRGPGAYKIPGFADIPSQFNVSLLRGAPNPRAIYSSKAVGEPPLFLASSAFFAIKDAIRSARKAAGGDATGFVLDSPATAERIRMACEDQFTKRVDPLPEEGSFRPWGIQV